MTGPRGDTRQRVLDTALTLFADRTYGATTLQDIADAMGVTKAALYYYFRTKDEILTALIEPSTAALEVILDRAESRPPAPAVVREVLVGLGELSARDRRRIGIMMFDRTFVTDAALGQRSRTDQERLKRVLVRGHEEDPDAEVRVLSALAALAVPFVALQDRDDPRPIIRPAVAAACAVLGIRPPRATASEYRSDRPTDPTEPTGTGADRGPSAAPRSPVASRG